ncbi:uncharacterized protein LOC111713177 isoform X2 [Eurytemora carolleeae]|uniref:uncharacterized protein LOC111713177 isoform X2 n=1 Tax=Eurytemora carolleeae TaxID=1294199 RepID=UPI000C77FFE7|nr:uncharacterized protein LOC111713177 isoform X2 [Eurytemora carolleeae]|eukprot:XP_023343766.1 uncharacterized protein LOC111713177 isoform X2 [Eurytemora affinis]
MLLLLLFLVPNVYSLSVLWIGNSYTYVNDVPLTVSKLAAAENLDFEYDSHTEGGWTWEMHSQSQETLDKIKLKQWDVVVLQEFSLRPAYDEDRICRNSVEYLKVLVERIRENNPQTIIQFYVTWGRPYGFQKDCPSYPQMCTYDSMQDVLTQSYTTFACMNKPSRASPVGEAFRAVQEILGDDEFFSLYNTNGVSDHHASAKGSYLSALVHFGSMFQRSIVGIPEPAGLDQITAEKLQFIGQNVLDSRSWEYPMEDDCSACICDCQE